MNPVYAPLGVAGIMSLMNKRTVSVERWRGIVEAQRASGLSVAAFCRRARVPQSSFFAWRRKLRDAVTFAEVQVAPEPACDPRGIELHLPGGRCVVVRAGFDRQTLLDLLATLEACG
jgi:hypothetical protein